MSATYAGIPLCQTTPEVRAWVERHAKLSEFREFNWHASPPTILHGLTYFQHTEAYVPLRLNTLRWPSGASRWGTYHFLATDEQLEEIRAEVYGEEPDPVTTSPKKLILHGSGETITADDMFLLPPRPLSDIPSWITTANKLWLCTLVDWRYYWNQDHCGELAAEDVGTWDKLLEFLRTRTGFDTDSWDCPSVDAAWLHPHFELQEANGIPLGIFIDAVAWNVGRRVSLDMERLSLAKPQIVHIRDDVWHSTRLQTNLTTANWYRMAGGIFDFDGRDLTACLPEKIRVTFSNEEDARTHEEITVNTLPEYTDENGVGTVVFHDRLEMDDATDAQRTALVEKIAYAWIGFQTKAEHDVSYAHHVKWLPEALSDFIEWHETIDEGSSLVPDPKDGKVRQRKLNMNVARTRAVRFPFNLVADDLWHGGSGAGSGSGVDSGGDEYLLRCPDGGLFKLVIDGITATWVEVEE